MPLLIYVQTTTTGMLYIGLTVGNIVGPQVSHTMRLPPSRRQLANLIPQLYKQDQAPRYSSGLEANLAVLAILTGLIVFQTMYLRYLNQRNVARRRASGKTGAVVDYSLEKSSKWKNLRADQAAQDATEGHVEEHNTQGFLDMTDRENEDFVYSL